MDARATFDLLGTEEDIKRAWYVAQVLEAVDWKWTPQMVLEQEELLLENVIRIATGIRIIKEEG